MAGEQPLNLWTEFNNRKLAAERAKYDWNGNPIVPANDTTITVKVADASTGPTAGSFTTNQSSAGTITIPAAISAPSGGSATPGVMSAADKEKLDSLQVYTVTDSGTNGNILVNGTSEIDVYTHPTDGPSGTTASTPVSAGDTTNQTPAFGGTFKVTSETVDFRGHTTTLAEHTVTIPSSIAVASTSGSGGSNGLMSATDKEKLDSVEAGAQANVKPDWNAASGSAAEILNKPTIPTVNDTTITIAYGNSSDTFTTNAGTPKTITIPTAATSSGTSTGGLMSSTDKANLDWLASVTPSSGTHEATPSNTVVTQSEMAAALADFGGFEVVSGDASTGEPVLPSGESPSTKMIYLVKDTTVVGSDKYNEWIWVQPEGSAGSYELIGDTTMDLTGYAQIPSGASQNHVVLFGNTDELVDSGKVISDLENTITGITVNSVAQTPVNKVVDIAVPIAETSTTPVMDGTASVGSATTFSKSDHVHPSDTSKQDVLVFNTAYDEDNNKVATMTDVSNATSGKADKVTGATAGNLASLDSNGNLTDSNVAASSVIQGVKLAGAGSALTPTSGVVTIPNAISTGTSGATNGLMTAAQSLMLDQINSWTWTYAEFTSSGMGTEYTSTFPFTVS